MRICKVVYNDCYGGFCLSEEAVNWINEKYGKNIGEYTYASVMPENGHYRHDDCLVECVELFGVNASGGSAALKIIEYTVPCAYKITEKAGCEIVEFIDVSEYIYMGE